MNETSESIEEAREPSESFEEALQRCGLDLPEQQFAQLDNYRELLWGWNKKLNLTRHTDFDTFASRDVVDAWQLAQHLQPGEEVLDVGSGGGAPGVILAIIRPDLQMTLAESVGKKAQTLDSIVADLELPVTVFNSRAEHMLDDFRYDVLVARAVGSMSRMLKWFDPHWAAFHRLLLIKGPRWVDERKEARERGLLSKLELRRVASYPMPGTESESVILQITLKE